jgi:hypothetical protein
LEESNAMDKKKKTLLIKVFSGVLALLIILLLNLHFFVQQIAVPVTVTVVSNTTFVNTTDNLANLPEKFTTAVTQPAELRLKEFNGIWFVILNAVVIVVTAIVIGRIL